MGAFIDTIFKGLDLAVFTFMHNLAVLAGESAGAEITSFFTHLMNFISFFAHDGLCMFALGVLLILFRRTRKLGVCVFVAVCCGGLITNITLKPLVARVRPYANFDHLAATVREWWVAVGEARKMNSIIGSFPSGHTTAAMAGAMAICLNFRKLRFIIPAICYAIVMGASRNYLMVHYPTDVLAGLIVGTIGAIAAFYITKLIYFLLEKHRDKKLFAFAIDFDVRSLFKKKEN